MFRWLLRSSFAVVLLAGIYCSADHFSRPGAMHRVLWPNGNVQLECPLDSAGRLHGDLQMYHPSGRLKSVTNYVHGQIGTGESYRDDEPDETTEELLPVGR